MEFFGQRLRLAADVRELEKLRVNFGDFLRQAGLGEEEVARWQLVLMEAAANAVIHGSQSDARRQVEVAWSAGDGRVLLEVADSGSGPSEGQTFASLPLDPLQTSGRGMYLIHQSCDRVEQWRGPEGFRLIMSRAAPGVRATVPAAEHLLQSALAEISQCYESLAAFYRLGEALIAAERLPDFFLKAMGDIAKVVAHDRVALYFQPALQPELLTELSRLPFASSPEKAGAVVKRVLVEGQELVWQEPREIAGDTDWGAFACGVAMPLRAGGLTLGVLTIARRRQPYLVASELSTVRTYADLFGIALANANNALVRGREQQALRELDIAATMQADLLPLPSTAAQPAWHTVVRRRCARTVAGDYVDVLPTPDGGLLLAMVDVMGKGMSAALFAGMVRTALRIHVEIGRSPGQLMRDLNRVLCAQTGQLTLFATCALAYISPERDRAQIVNAGHCPVLWVGAGGVLREFAPSAPPLGLYPETDCQVEEQTLAPGDQLVMVTDGLYEWESAGGESHAWAHLTDMARARHAQGGENLWEGLQERIQSAMPGETDPRDDQTLLVWQRRV
jgi:serine phosphatase RsbU (regulator of sigma subunit)/anti-sigma regulatory factor (Ser/Thr protein kinase)